MSGLKGTIEQGLVKALGKVRPTLKQSRFLSDGVLTPEEFVQAGDLLVYKCPAWTWEAGDAKKAVSYLPKDKQFLMTRSVPCRQRASALEEAAGRTTYETVQIEGDDGWVMNDGGDAEEEEDAGTLQNSNLVGGGGGDEGQSSGSDESSGSSSDSDSDDIPDMEDYEGVDNLEQPDDATLAAEPGDDNIIRSRSYDICITYDNYYQTPKLWLFGYDEAGKPLSAEQIFQDISEDHARKTVTIDNHPHLVNISYAFIHPCKHASVIKSLVQRSMDSGNDPRIDQYLFLFLKFMSAVIPTIEYDFSPNVNLGNNN